MKRFFPRTLAAWLLMVVIGGLLATQAAFFSIVAADRAESDQIVELYRLNERALWLVKLLSPADGAERKSISANLSNSTLAVTVGQMPAIASSIPPDDTLAELEDIMVARLGKYGITDARIRRDPAKPKAQAVETPAPSGSDTGEVESDLMTLARDFNETDRYTVSLQFKEGQWVNFTTPITPTGPMLAPERLPVYFGIAALVAFLSIWAVRTLAAPYLLLEEAVTRLGEDLKRPPISERGSREYRYAAKALNAMQKRILDYVEEREYLAAALAHDLRTPITKMRLRLELLRNSKVRDALASDIANVELTVKSVIDFVRLRTAEEELERTDLWSMVDSIVDDYPDASLDINGDDQGRLLCEVRPTALRRCLVNLIDNAIKYGRKAHISIGATPYRISITIADEGPGIPESRMQDVFKPFMRVENSRSRKTGGSGLGLTIARSLIQKMGGEITLSNAPGGGLSAKLSLPRSESDRQHALLRSDPGTRAG